MIIARQYVLMDYDIPNELVEKAVAITPGIESPTVSPLHESGWSAVRSMVEPHATPTRSWTSSGSSARAGILVTAITRAVCERRRRRRTVVTARPRKTALIANVSAAVALLVFVVVALS